MARVAILAFLSIFMAGEPLLAQAAGPAPAVVDGYRLGPLDQIEVTVANFPELATKGRIDSDGSIVMPLIGPVRLADRTPAEAAAEVARRYRDGGYVNKPNVRLEITEYQSRRASVLGQVVNQGLIVLDRQYSVAELLARAGGLAPDAGDTATIVRRQPDGSTKTIPVDLAVIGGPGALTPVQPGDIVNVPRAATFSVVGAVNKAGVYRLMPGMTVQQALATAGDIARIGTKGGLRIRRATVSGGSTLVKVGLDDVLRPGDIVVVRERIF